MLLAAMLTAACSGTDPASVLESARKHRDRGEHPTAIIELRNLIATAPDNRDARRLLAATYLDNGEPGPAEDELRKLIEMGTDKLSLLAPLGRALLLQGKHERLLEEIQLDPNRQSPDWVEIATVRALSHIALGNSADAKVLLDRVLGTDPKNPDALMGLAGIAAGERRFDEAEGFLDRAIEANPKSLDAWLLKGDLNRLRDKRDPALAAYKRALEIRSDNVVAHMQLASLYIDQQKYDEAARHVEFVRAKQPNDAMPNYLVALIEFRKGNHPTAQKAIGRALQQNPGHTPTLLLAGAVEYAVGNYEASVQHLRTLLDRAPGSMTARRMLAVSLIRSGQNQRAIDLIEQTLATVPNDGPMLMLAGEAHLQNNDLSSAAQFLERAAKVDPSSERARTGLNIARMMTGQSDRALAELEAAVAPEGASPHLGLILVATLLQRREFDKALATLGKLDKRQANNPVVYNLRAAALIGKGDVAGARRSLEAALAINPRFVPAAVNLANLDLQERNPRQARRRLEGVLERDPGNQQALLALAGFGDRIGASHDLIIDWLERARRAHPTATQPLVMLADRHLSAGNAKQALAFATEAQRHGQDNPQVLEILGMAQVANGDTNGALGTFSKLALASPQSPRILFRLASVQLAANNPAGATLTLRRALSVAPDHVPSLALLGNIELRVNRHDNALGIARDLQKRFPRVADGYVLEGEALVAQGKPAEAVKSLQAAQALGDRSARVAIRLSGALEAAGRPQEATAMLDRWSKENPSDVSAHAFLGDRHLQAGRWAAAIDRYQKVLLAQPENAAVLNNVAWASFKLNDRRARSFAQKAVELRPNDPVMLDTYGWILTEAGEADRGVELLQRAVTLAPDARDIRLHLAKALVRIGNYSRARRELEVALAGSGPFEGEAEARELQKKLRY